MCPVSSNVVWRFCSRLDWIGPLVVLTVKNRNLASVNRRIADKQTREDNIILLTYYLIHSSTQYIDRINNEIVCKSIRLCWVPGTCARVIHQAPISNYM